MKTLIKINLAVLCVTAINMAFAQDPQSGPTFKNLDSIQFQFLKYDMSLTDFPVYDPCNREGTAPITIVTPDPGGLQPYDPPFDHNPILDSSFYKHPPMEEVNIFWLHGLNGSLDSWHVAAYATEFGVPGIFDARRANCFIPNALDNQSYAETIDIRSASTDVEKAVESLTNIQRTDKDFIIAHSQGGIVAREWLRNMEENPTNFTNYAHGLVTFGTPHIGARILNNTRPDMGNKLPGFFREACKSVGGGIVTQKINSSFLASLVVTQKMKDIVVESACEGLVGTVIPFALDNYFQATTNDYFVGSPFLEQPNISGHPTSLKDYTLNVPVVQFYGEEEQPIMWRFFSSTLNLGADQLNQTGSASGVFSYDQDDQLQNSVNKMINEFTALKELEENRWKDLFSFDCLKKARKSCTILNSPCVSLKRRICLADKISKLKDAKDNAEAYGKAATWLSNANEYYLYSIVGGKVDVQNKYCFTETIEQCITSYPLSNPPLPLTMSSSYNVSEVLAPNAGCPSNTSQSTTTTFVNNKQTICNTTVKRSVLYRNSYKYLPNDGVVLAESAAAPIKVNTAVSTNSHTYRVMPKTNHNQMRNSRETKNALTFLYEGKMGKLFQVDLR
jgi:pimeloyl-ACP methyl ester carboxylesterase